MNQKMIFFDTGPIITLVMSRLVWILPLLKKQFGGQFYITPSVKYELVERPLTVKRFSFEALQVLKLVNEGILTEYRNVPSARVESLIKLANNTFKINNKYLEIIQKGEVESVASAIESKAPVIMDERTLRLFIENRKEMQRLLEIRFKKGVEVNNQNMEKFSSQLKDVTIIRSLELIGVAFKLGFLDEYIPKRKGGRELLLDSVLWAAKSNGSAVTEHEIEEIKKYLLN